MRLTIVDGVLVGADCEVFVDDAVQLLEGRQARCAHPHNQVFVRVVWQREILLRRLPTQCAFSVSNSEYSRRERDAKFTVSLWRDPKGAQDRASGMDRA